MDDLLAGAEKVAIKLGAPCGGEFRSWLRDTVGSLHARNREVGEALGALEVTLATTNYDSILEEVTGRPPVTWRQGSDVERVLRGEDQGILHLHGHWKDPESVILGIRSYEAVLQDEHAQAMQKILRATRTLLFVGYGAGLGDPNFGALLAWSRSLFAGSEYRHYLLTRADEVAATQAKHPREERIFVIPYGEHHSDLAPFLRSLVPPAKAHGPPPAPFPGASIGLPARSPCFGRADEIEDLVATVLGDPAPPTPILGGPGIGKSTVALAAVHDDRVAARYGSRRYFARCDGLQSREGLASEISRAVGATPSPEPETALLQELARGPSVLIIDNAETPWESESLPVEELLAQIAGVPGVALVASLRGTQARLGSLARGHSNRPPRTRRRSQRLPSHCWRDLPSRPAPRHPDTGGRSGAAGG